MSRIYQSESKANFQGSARGGRFQPKEAVDSSKAIREYKDGIAQDFDTQAREQQRKDQAENLQLSKADQAEATGLALQASFDTFGLEAQQSWATSMMKQEQLYDTQRLDSKASQLKGRQNKTALVTSTIDSLLQFGGSVVSYAENVRIYEERELKIRKLQEAEELKNQEIAARNNFLTGQPDWPTVEQDANIIDAEAKAVGNSIGKIATELEATGNIDDIQAATTLRGESPTLPYIAAQKDVYGARNAFIGTLRDAYRALPQASRPKTRAEATAYFRALSREYYKVNGLYALPPALVDKVFAPTAIENINTLVAEAVSGANESQKLDTTNRTKSIVTEMVTNNVSPQLAWESVSAGFGDGTYTSKSNQEGIEFLAKAYADQGKPEMIDKLHSIPKIKGQPNGPTLGSEYGHILRKYKDLADTAETARFETQYADALDGMYGELALPENANNPDNKTAIALRYAELIGRIPGKRLEAQQLRDQIPDLNNPQNQALIVEQMQQRIDSGEIVDPKAIDDMIALDVDIKNQLKTQLAEKQQKFPDNPEIESVMDSLAEGLLSKIETDLGITKSIDGTITYPQNIDQFQAQQLTSAAKTQMFRVGKAALLANANKPKAEQTRAVREAITQWAQANVYNPEGLFNFKKDDSGLMGQGAGAAAAKQEQKIRNVLNSPIALNRVKSTAKSRLQIEPLNLELDPTGVITAEQADLYSFIRKDKLYSKEVQQGLADSYMQSGQMPQGILDNAQKLGKTPLALLNEQNLANGLPTTIYRPPTEATSLGDQSASPQDIRTYMISKGLPEASANYLAGTSPASITEIDQTLERLKGVTLFDGRDGYSVFMDPRSTNRNRTAALSALQKMSYNGSYTGGSLANQDVMAIHQLAQRLQVDPYSLGALIQMESGHRPNVWGGDGGKYKGLIQFGPGARSEVGLPNRDMTIAEQIPYVEKYFKQRGFKPGKHGVTQLYRTVLVGNPYQSGTDSNNTNSDTAAQMMMPGGSLYQDAQKLYGTFTPQ